MKPLSQQFPEETVPTPNRLSVLMNSSIFFYHMEVRQFVFLLGVSKRFAKGIKKLVIIQMIKQDYLSLMKFHSF
jgi:hypothetical protein